MVNVTDGLEGNQEKQMQERIKAVGILCAQLYAMMQAGSCVELSIPKSNIVVPGKRQESNKLYLFKPSVVLPIQAGARMGGNANG